ncbi:AAA family ATPase [Kitasatospora cineracea]|uniref:AAA family ATPase n=1 Tax=Kitasatospora cineracea TaxID=88074 RepID=UPI0034482269
MTESRPEEQPDGQAVAADVAPRWAVSLFLELCRGRQAIVTGRVRDRWWLAGRPASFRTVLANWLHFNGSDVVAWWDPVGGLTFPLEGHQERFAALGRRAVPDGPADRRTGPGALDAEEPAPTRTPRGDLHHGNLERLSRPRPPVRRFVPIDEALAEAHRLAADESNAIAFVFEDLDLALPADQPSSTLGYLRLRAAMTDAVAPLVGEHAAALDGRPRNPVLAVVGDLGRLPGWLHQEDPRTVVLHVAPPDQTERRLWFSMTAREFNGGAQATRAEFEPLVAATDGMSGWELNALARSSHVRRVAVQQPARLLDRHRLNVTADPWTQLDHRTVLEAAGELGDRVIGQPAAVDAVVSALRSAYAGIGFGSSGAARPRGAFFFVGPTGVGKTELAKSVAQLIFGDPSAYARFDMSEYQQEHSAERLAGSPPGYLGNERGGELTRRVQERPFSVLLFDEIEKAHPVVLDKFLQILEDGRLTDGQGRTAHFSQSLIIFTSNTGADGLPSLLAEFGDELPYKVLQQHFTDAVEDKFRAIGRPEIYGRLKPGVVVFDMLRTAHVVGIAERLLAQLAESVHERHRVELVPDRPSLDRWITDRMTAPERRAYGGRQIRNEFEAVLLAVVRHLVERRPAPGTRLLLTVDEDEVRVTPDPGPGEDED